MELVLKRNPVERLKREKGPLGMLAELPALIAAGYEQLGKPAEAAERYKRAAAAAEFAVDQANLKASAARAYTAAGRADAARELWTELAGDPTSALSGEARVRLGELTAQPVKRS